MSGRVLQKEKLLDYRIDVNQLSNGIYFLMLYKEKELIGNTQKFIKNQRVSTSYGSRRKIKEK